MTTEYKRIIIDGCKTDYLIYNTGEVFSINRNKFIKPEKSNCGYYRVTIYFKDEIGEKIRMKVSLHRLVAITFIPNPENKSQVNHKDGDKSHNYVTNLEWVTPSENGLHAYKTNLKKKKFGDDSHLQKYNRESVIKACKMMENGDYTISEISILTKISQDMLYLIRDRKSWVNISQWYEVDRCKSSYLQYSDNQIESVFIMLEQNKLSIYDISDDSGVKVDEIYCILGRRKGTDKYNRLYNMYDIKKYTGRKKLRREITDEIKIKIRLMIEDGEKKKTIINSIVNEFNYNEALIRHYINRHYKLK